jgi:diacylglycerol kinase
MSDMPPQHECIVVGIANTSIEEVADATGIPEAQKYSKVAGNLKR